jgi:hypothetical protein
MSWPYFSPCGYERGGDVHSSAAARRFDPGVLRLSLAVSASQCHRIPKDIRTLNIGEMRRGYQQSSSSARRQVRRSARQVGIRPQLPTTDSFRERPLRIGTRVDLVGHDFSLSARGLRVKGAWSGGGAQTARRAPLLLRLRWLQDEIEFDLNVGPVHPVFCAEIALLDMINRGDQLSRVA